MSDKCPLKSCDKPWSKHEGVERVVHSEKAEEQLPYGSNGGVRCDTSKGPCNCGAWH